MSAIFYVILGIAVALLGVLLMRERRCGKVLVGAACLIVGAYQAIDGLMRINGHASPRRRWRSSSRNCLSRLPRVLQCAVQRCTVSVGANPTRQGSFQPIVVGTAVEVTKQPKLSM